ncbi:MAG: hypothetical protein WC943_12240 [Elusimicrobiota bacterium]|jgi:hypothetical protein
MMPGLVKETVKTLGVLAEAEEAVAGLYKVFAEKDASEQAFWSGLVNQETAHAHNMRSMARMLEANPSAYLPGRPFNIAAIQTFIRGIKENIARAVKGEISAHNAFFVAKDIEGSILENRIHEIVRTDDPEFRKLIDVIVGQTAEHDAEMKKKIAALPA